jgi:hypothetical protein
MTCPFHQQQPDPFGAARRKDGRIETLAAADKYENESSYRRRLAYDRLTVRFVARSSEGTEELKGES